jgi:hypothetical protein
VEFGLGILRIVGALLFGVCDLGVLVSLIVGISMTDGHSFLDLQWMGLLFAHLVLLGIFTGLCLLCAGV